MDHLFNDFKQKGIHAFSDDRELPKGEEISPHLYTAIEESKFLIVIFSKNYASSSWCLRELVKILQCKKIENPKHEVQTIFYDVKPDVVRNQTESYAEAFAKHQDLKRPEVDNWKEALSMAANISGWDLQEMTNGYEYKFIDCIPKDILKKLSDGPLARSCFCEDVKEVAKRQGIIHVQMHLINKILKAEDLKISCVSEGPTVIKQRMACKPIFLVLDDVVISDQVNEIHDMNFLDEDQSLQLFSFYAFEEKHPSTDFQGLAYTAVKYVQGHPLALTILGCFLYGKNVAQWVSELDRLKLHPNEEIQQVLRLSYDGLNLHQQSILLDIACSFVGENRDFTASILDICFADTNIQEIVVKNLRRLGTKQIVGNHQRFQYLSERKFDIDVTAFAQMKNLRILKLPKDDAVNFFGKLDFLSNNLRLLYWHGCPFKLLPSDFSPENMVIIDLSYSNIKQLWTTPKLRYCCNLTTTPDFSEITNLEELDLEGCVNLVTVHPSIGMLKRLSLNLSFCDLEQVPDGLGGLSCLKYLDLKANNFTSLPGSLSKLSHLQTLELDGCKKLEVLPELPHSLETNHAIESQAWISDTECLDSSVTSQGSTNRFSSFLGYLRIQNNRHGFFRLPGSSIENMDMIYRGNSIPNWTFSKGCNSSFIALIPKVSDAKFVNEYRPISLIGSVYKVVTKIMANRLSMVIAGIVSDSQSAFVAERQILDGPFILNEILHWSCKRKEKESMFLK
ncbi:NB-ARC domains-containing protein [Tanacetum coccineum]